MKQMFACVALAVAIASPSFAQDATAPAAAAPTAADAAAAAANAAADAAKNAADAAAAAAAPAAAAPAMAPAAPAEAAKDYPACSKTVTDNCQVKSGWRASGKGGTSHHGKMHKKHR